MDIQLLDKKLTIKQQRFVDEYLIDGNATRAATASGYSKKTAASQGERLLRNVEIKAAISKAEKERAERTKIDADYVLKRHAEIDALDVLDILDDTGNVLPIRQWPKAWRISISGLDLHELISGDTETIIRKIKLPDKTRNLELLGKHTDIQAYKDRVENVNKNVDIKIPEGCTAEEAAAAYSDLIKSL